MFGIKSPDAKRQYPKLRNARILNPEQIKQFCSEWNIEHCYPPLDKDELEKQWKNAIKFIEKKSNKENENSVINENEGNGERTKTHTNAELLIDLATTNTKLLFKDQYGTAFALVKIIDHNELIAIANEGICQIRFDKCLVFGQSIILC